MAYADVLAAVRRVTNDPNVIAAMMVGSFMESGWSDTASGGGAYGPFQLQDPSKFYGLSIAQAENPDIAARTMVQRYEAAVRRVGPITSPHAAGMAAYYAEKPKVYYGDSRASEAWNAYLHGGGKPGAPGEWGSTTGSPAGDPNAVGGLAGALLGLDSGLLGGIAKAVQAFVGWVTMPHFAMRMFAGLAGVPFLLLGVFFFATGEAKGS